MIREGFISGCGIELFTHGWVRCEQPAIGGGDSQRKQKKPSQQDIYHQQALQEDEEILLLIEALFQTKYNT